MKKFIATALILTVVLSASGSAFAPASASSSILAGTKISVLKAGSASTVKSYPVRVRIKGKTNKTIGSKAMMKNKLIYLKIKSVANVLGFKTTITSKEIMITKGETIIEFFFKTNTLKTKLKTIKLKSKTFKYKKSTFVSLTFIKKALNTTCDWFPSTKTVVIYSADNGQKSLYQRLYDSGEYKLYPQTVPVKYRFGIALMNKNSKYNYSISVDISDPVLYRSDLHIKIRKYDKATREKVREILKMAYPYKNKEVFKLFIATIREEIYKNEWDTLNHPGISYIYFEGRLLNLYKELNGANFVTFDIGVKDHKYPKPEDDDDQLSPWRSNSKELKAMIKKYSIYYDKK